VKYEKLVDPLQIIKCVDKLSEFLEVVIFIEKPIVSSKNLRKIIPEIYRSILEKNFIHLSKMKNQRRIAEFLLQSKAIILEPASPFTWASGWKSPIYCDNRKTLSYPGIRSEIRDAYVEAIRKQFRSVEVIAGVATGAIAQGALVADAMSLPFVYVRSTAKGHGMKNMVEGSIRKDQKVVVVEDLISTGGSSLRAINALRAEGCTVLGMVATFDYGFKISEMNFKQEEVTVVTLTDYESMLAQAVESRYISEVQLPLLRKWRQDPENWNGE